jgi:hypothetical protein
MDAQAKEIKNKVMCEINSFSLFRKTMSYFNSVHGVGHVNLFLNIACIMNGATKKQTLTKQNPLKVFYYNKIIAVKTLLSVKK